MQDGRDQPAATLAYRSAPAQCALARARLMNSEPAVNRHPVTACSTLSRRVSIGPAQGDRTAGWIEPDHRGAGIKLSLHPRPFALEGVFRHPVVRTLTENEVVNNTEQSCVGELVCRNSDHNEAVYVTKSSSRRHKPLRTLNLSDGSALLSLLSLCLTTLSAYETGSRTALQRHCIAKSLRRSIQLQD